ncbi:MAG: helix-turn-helix domain-containing protein [Bacteroidetes bacterium]|nr:helix-turn-helix domain-containing protein [Bacteroidota bacterium]
MSNPDIKKMALTIPEAAKLSGLSVSYLYRLSAEGRLPVAKIGARCVLPYDVYQKWLNDHIRRAKGEIENT